MPRNSLASVHFQTDCGSDLSRFVNNPELHDVTIVCGLTTFYAHSDILCSRCAALEDILRSEGNVLELETDPEVILHILRYIYTARFPDVHASNLVSELLRIARQLRLQDLTINLMLRFCHLECDDRDSEERDADSGPRDIPEEGEGHGFRQLPSTGLLRGSYSTPFFDCLKFNGKVTINVGPYKFRRQSAVLLAARSTWFAERIDAVECIIDASAVPVQQMALALRFMKMEGAEELDSFGSAFDALYWAWVLGIHSLQSWIEHVIVTRYLDCHNVCQIWSSPACGEYLAERCMQFLQANFLACASSSGFLNLRHEMIKDALNAGRIEADAVSMVSALRRWAETNTSRPDERDQLLLDLLPPNTIFNMDNRMCVLGISNRCPLSCNV